MHKRHSNINVLVWTPMLFLWFQQQYRVFWFFNKKEILWWKCLWILWLQTRTTSTRHRKRKWLWDILIVLLNKLNLIGYKKKAINTGCNSTIEIYPCFISIPSYGIEFQLINNLTWHLIKFWLSLADL